MSRGDYNPGSGSYGFVTKKCPECYTHLPLRCKPVNAHPVKPNLAM
jgi:hypothetical protein